MCEANGAVLTEPLYFLINNDSRTIIGKEKLSNRLNNSQKGLQQ